MAGSPLPQFRADLEVLPNRRGSRKAGYILRDPHTEWVFELGEEDYFICQQLDGRTSFATLQARYEERFGETFSPAELDAFLEQLRRCGFLRETASVSPEELEDVWGQEDHGKIYRFPLVHTDGFFSWLAPRVRWVFTRQFVWLSLPVVLFSLWLMITHWSTYTRQFDQLWQFSHLMGLALVGLLGVMIPREVVGGCALKLFGGVVPTGGISIARLRPRVFVDLRAARWIPKPAKIRVIFAHGYVPIVVWAVGTIGWWLTTPGTRMNSVWLFLSATAAWSALWNWNPKLPRDGYQLLSVWFETRRLRPRAMRAFERLFVSWEPTEPLSRRERCWFLAFGFGAWLYLILHVWIIWGSVGSALVRSFQGAGAAVFVLAFLYCFPGRFTKPLKRAGLWLLAGKARLGVRRLVRLGLAATVLTVMFLPYPYQTGGPFKILPLKQTEIHAEVEGRITEVLVRENSWVERNQALARIDPREYEKNLETAREQLTAAEAQLRLLRAGPKPEEVERAEQQVQKAEQDVREARVKLNFSRPRAERYTELYREEAVSRQEYENALRTRDVDIEQLNVNLKALEVAKANLAVVKSGPRPEEIEAQEAEVRRLQTVVRNYEEQLRLTVLTSPAEGRVITPYIDQRVGQYLKKGDLFAVVADPRTVQIEVQVPEEEAPQVRRGAAVQIVPWAFPHKTFLGTVLSVAPVATHNEGLTTVRVLAEIPNPDQVLKADMTGYAKISAAEKPVWDVLFRPLIRWFQVEFWYWIP